MTTGQVRDLVRMWARGWSATRISVSLGVPRSTVYGYAQHHRDECPRRSPNGRPVCPESDARAASLLGSGMARKEAARMLGVDPRTVVAMAKRHERRQGDALEEMGREP